MKKILANFICMFIPFGDLRRKIRNKMTAPAHDNFIFVIEKDGTRLRKRSIKGIKIKFLGSGNIIEIEKPYSFVNSRICVNSGIHVYIAKNCQIQWLIISNACWNFNTKITIGQDFVCNGMNIAPSRNGDITIGNHCTFSWGICIKSSDDHLVYNIGSQKPLLENLNNPIVIGNHVWIGMNALILKGVKIPNNSIVGAGSVVTRKFDQENTAIAGNPAKVIKTDVVWER